MFCLNSEVYSQQAICDRCESIYDDYVGINNMVERIDSTIAEHFSDSYFYIFYDIDGAVSGISFGDLEEEKSNAVVIKFEDGKLVTEKKPVPDSVIKTIKNIYGNIDETLLQNAGNHSLMIERTDYRSKNIICASFKDVLNSKTHNFIHFGQFHFGQKDTDLHALYIICYDILIRLTDSQPF